MNTIRTTFAEEGLPSFPITYNFAADTHSSDVIKAMQKQDEAVAKTLLMSEDATDDWGNVLDQADEQIDRQLEASGMAGDVAKAALFDTVIETYGAREAAVVVAHEVEIGLTAEQADGFADVAGPLVIEQLVEYDQQAVYA